MPLAEMIVASAVAFASTNIDDAFVLLAFFGDSRFRRGQVVLGQYLGMGALLLVSTVLAALAIRLPEGATRSLGVVPILMGIRQVWRLRSGTDEMPLVYESASGVLSVAAVTVSNGADNVAVYVPLLVKVRWSEFPVLGVVFTVLTAVWCGAAIWLLKHGPVEKFFDRWGHRAMPVVLILLGTYILLRN